MFSPSNTRGRFSRFACRAHSARSESVIYPQFYATYFCPATVGIVPDKIVWYSTKKCKFRYKLTEGRLSKPHCPPRPHITLTHCKSYGEICPSCPQNPSGPWRSDRGFIPLNYVLYCSSHQRVQGNDTFNALNAAQKCIVLHLYTSFIEL